MNPEDNEKHKQYINEFCDDFERELKSMMEAAMASRDARNHVTSHVTGLAEEVTQHARFCQEKCRGFYGREDALRVKQKYKKRCMFPVK